MNAFSNDRTSGSSGVAEAFLHELERWAALDTSTSAPALRQSLLGWIRQAQASQPSMALIHHLSARALEVADTGVQRAAGVADLRAHLAQSCTAERADLVASRSAVARTACELAPDRDSWIATLSASGVVRDALLLLAERKRKPRALIAESRPRVEGRSLAAALAAAGIPTWLVVDAALPMLLSQTSAVWLGADAVTDRGVINKVGSFAAALAARESSVPVYALAGRRKFIPASTPALRIEENPSEEVWEEPPAGVLPRNLYFELVPLELFRGIVVEDGVLGPTEAALLASERPLPDELAAAR